MIGECEKAEALLAQARQIRSKIGDHGDSYEESLAEGTVAADLNVSVKQIVGHLADALDCVAQAIAGCCSPARHDAVVRFPIAQKTYTAADYRSELKELMPEVATNRPDLISALESIQFFASPDNVWLADFETVATSMEGELLNVVTREIAWGRANVDDKSELTFSVKNGKPAMPSSLSLIKGFSDATEGKATVCYLSLSAIAQEVLTFLDTSISGVTKILQDFEGRLPRA